MNRSFSLWLLCSSMLLSASAFAAEEALPAKTTPDASVPAESAPAGDSTAALPWASTQEKPAADTAASAPVELKPSNEKAAVKPQTAPEPEIPPAADIVPLASSTALAAPKATPAAGHGHEAPANLSAGGLTLDAAIQKALNASPRLRSATASVLASRGERRQASALPNPEVGVDTENFAGKGDYKGTNSLETTVGVTQLIELGGKRGSRMDMADQGLTVSQLGLEGERLNLIRDVTVAFVEVAASEEHLKIVGEQRDLAEDVFGEVSKRVSAAREPMIQQSKAEVTRATARIAYENAGRELEQAKRRLTSLWGGGAEPVVLNTGTLFELQEPPPAPAVESTLAQNPDFTRWDAEIKRSQAAYDLERANAIPDPRVSFGMRDYRESGDRAFVAGVSIPIPVFNMNRGNIERARHTVSKTESDAQATKLQLGTDLNQRYQEMNIAYAQVESLEHEIIPAAEKSFRLSRAGYREGKFAFLEILDAQRTLFDAKEQRVAALRSYHVARAEVERLSAKNLQNTVVKEDDHAE